MNLEFWNDSMIFKDLILHLQIYLLLIFFLEKQILTLISA